MSGTGALSRGDSEKNKKSGDLKLHIYESIFLQIVLTSDIL